MELKSYQQQALTDLARYLDIMRKAQGDYARAFQYFWENHPHFPTHETYRDTLEGVPHLCLKIPTAGGKTYIACNALKPLLDGLEIEQNRLVVWLVPSQAILEQTKNNLKNPKHFYRQRLNALFAGKVEVYDVEELLEARNFSPRTVQENVSILVLSYQSIRFDLAKLEDDKMDKTSRRIYKTSGRLMSFFENETDTSYRHKAKGVEEKSLINAIRKHKPLCIIDEAHNATSDLSVEMLANLNPSFVLELTATPRKLKTKGKKQLDAPVYLSNILTYIDSFPLKQENMVKLPLLVYNGSNRTDILKRAIALQEELESIAKHSADYIRPIVLFQAESVKQQEERDTYDKIKQELIQKFEIPAEQIAIKTANIDEIKGVDLMDKKCKIRFIITINALKEGWDCPFAYVLASVANRTSEIEIEQLVGRVLRKPYTKEQTGKGLAKLNMSYVLTSSRNFQDVLDNIVDALNGQGFSKDDIGKTTDKNPESMPNHDLFGNEPQHNAQNTPSKQEPAPNPYPLPTDENGQESEGTEKKTFEEAEDLYEHDKQQTETDAGKEQAGNKRIPTDLKPKVNLREIKDEFKEIAKQIVLPQFFFCTPAIPQIKIEATNTLLSYENLLEGFELRNQSIDIDFSQISLDLYQIDLEGENIMQGNRFVKAKATEQMQKLYLEAFAEMTDAQKNKTLTENLIRKMGNIPPFKEADLRKYVQRIVESRTYDEINDMNIKQRETAGKIKTLVEQLGKKYAHETFYKYLDSNKIVALPNYRFPAQTACYEDGKMPKSLYHKVEGLNGWEERFILEILTCSNVVFWHKFGNRGAHNFCLNAGFMNYYPDFLLYTRLGNLLLIDTKGTFLLNADTDEKNELGKRWQYMAGQPYKHFIVVEKANISGYYALEKFIGVLRSL